MTTKKAPGLLIVMGIILMIGGIVRLIYGLIGVFGGGAMVYGGAVTGVGILVEAGIAIMCLSLLAGILELLMGIFGIRGTHLHFCLVMAIIVVALDLSQLILSHGAHVTEPIISLIISTLYLIGVIVAMRRE